MEQRGLRAWHREPVVQFLALGALLFALHTWLGRVGAGGARPRIDVTAAQIDALRADWIAVQGQAPSEVELRRMVDERIREEVLFREATALDLDRDDAILRRRMVQKMEFLLQDVTGLAQPSDAELAAFLAADPATYRLPARLSFTHVYLNPDRRGDAVEQDAAEVLARLRAEDPARAPGAGDRFLRGLDHGDLSQDEAGRLFGDAFAAELFALPAGDWRGPIASSYGLHLVRVSDRAEGRIPELEEVRESVLQDLLAARQREAEARLVATLRERYRVAVDEEALARAADRPVPPGP